MTLFPRLQAAWLNGWLLLVIYGVVFGSVVRSFPKDIVARLYDKSHWTRPERILTTVGKVLSSILFALLAFSPLRIGHPVFVIGSALFGLGLIGLVVALFHFKNAPPGQPATNGLYRLSRNPQWVTLVIMFVGACLVVGSWAALIVFGLAAVCYHVRILAEERSCLRIYGSAYRDYLGRVPRYVLFL
jgi:protein-S-isoprenylcysteine O-methyltransferase Ste14